MSVASEPFDLALIELYSAKPNYRRYRRLVELAADAGDPLGQYAMATWYLHGNADVRVRRNYRKAVALLTKAARTFNRAMYDLAVCKFRGEGTARDPRAGYKLLARAAELGSVPAMIEQAECLANGVGVRRDVAAARALKRKAMRYTVDGASR